MRAYIDLTDLVRVSGRKPEVAIGPGGDAKRRTERRNGEFSNHRGRGNYPVFQLVQQQAPVGLPRAIRLSALRVQTVSTGEVLDNPHNFGPSACGGVNARISEIGSMQVCLCGGDRVADLPRWRHLILPVNIRRAVLKSARDVQIFSPALTVSL
jgi:hypothetical protein